MRSTSVQDLASCGGHTNPKESQVGAGKFMVSLDIDQDESGWRAIAIISIAIDLLRTGDLKLSSRASIPATMEKSFCSSTSVAKAYRQMH